MRTSGDDTAGRGAALILGAGPRLGAAIARALGAAGRPVGLVGRSLAHTEDVATSLRADGVSAFADAADIADAAALTAAISRLAETCGPFFVAVHNVSVWRDAGAGSLTAAEILADLAVGAASLATLVNAVLPGMTAAGRGTIIATGSGAADAPTAGAPSLSLQKAALRNLVRGYAKELAPQGIHVATVTVLGGLGEPGFAVDDIAAVYADLAAETRADRETWRTVVEFDGTH